MRLLKRLAAPVLVVAFLLVRSEFWEIYNLPENLDTIFYNAYLGPPFDAGRIVEELNALSSWEKPRYNKYSDEEEIQTVVSGYSFRREREKLVIYHASMNSWSANRICNRFRENSVSSRWKLLPVVTKNKWTGDTPSWGDWLLELREAGFAAIVLTDGHNNWVCN